MILIPVALLAIMYWSAKRAKPLGGFYKAINVCGRWYNYFMVDFLFAGVVGMVSVPVLLVTGTRIPMVLLVLDAVCSAAIFVLGYFMYKRVYAKCPDELKSRFLQDMLVMGIGTATRVSLFILMFMIKTWWELTKPTEYIVNGQIVYAFPDSKELYDSSGTCVGIANDGMTKATMY